MTPQDQIAKLEGLMARIKRNAALPRPVLAAVASVPEQPAVGVASALAAAPVADLDEPGDFDLDSLPPPAPPAQAAPAIDELDDFGELAAEPPADAAAADDLSLDVAEDLDLIDEEIVDITDLDAEEAAAIEAEAAAFEDAAEPPPSSSPRPKATAASMDEALASAAEELGEEEREVPLKTPPPESGDQMSSPPLAGADLRHRDVPADLLEVDEHLARREISGPTPEQLGETIDLDEPLGPALELDTAKAEPPLPVKPSELEAPLASAAAGTYDEALEAPPEAAADLARHRAREQAAAAVPAAPAAPVAPAASGELAPVVVARPVVATAPAAFAAAASFQPQSFLELLDASLGL